MFTLKLDTPQKVKKFIALLVLFLAAAVVWKLWPVSDERFETPTPVATDPYAGWQTVTVGGVVSVMIPPGCTTGAAAGSTYVTCPTPGNDTPTPDMVLSSDGQTVDIRHWEDLSWDQWDAVVSTLKVLEPLDRDVKITIEHD